MKDDFEESINSNIFCNPFKHLHCLSLPGDQDDLEDEHQYDLDSDDVQQIDLEESNSQSFCSRRFSTSSSETSSDCITVRLRIRQLVTSKQRPVSRRL